MRRPGLQSGHKADWRIKTVEDVPFRYFLFRLKLSNYINRLEGVMFGLGVFTLILSLAITKHTRLRYFIRSCTIGTAFPGPLFFLVAKSMFREFHPSKGQREQAYGSSSYSQFCSLVNRLLKILLTDHLS